MALLTTGTFATISIRHTNAAEWAAASPRPEIGPGLIDKVVDGTAFVIYVIDDAAGTFAYVGGQATGWTDALLLSSSSSSHATETVTDGAGRATVWCTDASGNVYSYLESEGFLRSYSALEAGQLKAFLP